MASDEAMSRIQHPISLADWRRLVVKLYAAVRASDDPELAWRGWREERDRLFREHPQSPLESEHRARFSGLAYFDYDPAARFAVDLDTVEENASQSRHLGDDGVIALQPFARTRGLAPALGAELTLSWITGYGGGIFLPFANATSGRETTAAGGIS